MFVPTFLRKRIEHARKKTFERVENAKEVFYRSGIVALIAAVIVWGAIFLYIAFYYAYMPSISHVRPVHLQFKSCDETRGICSFPTAHVQLTKRQQILMVGQPYKMFLNLDMPESPANKRLGMFMVCVQLHDKEHSLVANSCRSTMLHYRSYLIQIISTIILSPFMIFGSTEEKQNIVLELYSDFEEDQNHPITDIYVEVQSRHVELYSAVLHIHAHFTGLRYLMFHWPVLSAVVGISSNLFFIVLIALLSWLRLYQFSEDNSDSCTPIDESDEKRDVFVFKGESDESSFEDSFVDDPSKFPTGVPDLNVNPTRDFITELPKSESFQMIQHTSSSDC